MLESIVSFFYSLTTTSFCVPGPCPSSPSPDNPWIFPSILVYWSLGLIFIAFVAAGHLFWLTERLRGSFLRLAEALHRGRDSGHLMTRTTFEQVDDILRTENLTSEGWDEFKETILREEKEETGEVVIFNTRTAVEFFPYSAVEQHIPAFHRLMPVTLTSAGLLGTFLALLLGLHAVHVPNPTPTLEEKAALRVAPPSTIPSGNQPALPQQSAQSQKVEGVEDLVNSLSGKFLSSIIALLLSMFYAMGEAMRLRQVDRAYHRFCTVFDALFVRKTPESYLQKILEETEKQSAAFRHFNTDLSGYLKQSFQESLGPTLDRLTDTLERLTNTNEERMAQLIGSLSEAFRSNLAESAQSEFQQLARALQQTTELLQAMNTQSQSAQEGLGKLLVRLGESQHQQTVAAEAQRKITEDLFAQIARQVQGMAEQNGSHMEQTVNKLLERTAGWSNDTTTRMTQVLTDHARVFEERMDTLLARLDTIVEEMSRSTRSGTENLLAGVGQAVAQLQKAVTSVADTMQSAASGVVQQTGDASAQFRENIEQVMTKLLENLTHSSKSATADMAGIFVQHAGIFEGKTKTLLDLLIKTATEMRQSTQAGNNSLSATTKNVAERLEQIFTQVVSAMKGASVEVTQQISTASAQLSEQIRPLLAQQSQQMRDTQAAYESLGQATEGIRGLLKDSGEAFGQMRPLTSDLVATTRDLRSVGEVARNAHDELRQVTGAFVQQGQILQQTITSQREMLNEFSKVFDQVSQGLGGILRQIGEEMQKYQDQSAEGLNKQVQQIVGVIELLTTKINLSVESVMPGLEGLAEAIDAAARRIGSNGGRR